jgi:hypothetical protein
MQKAMTQKNLLLNCTDHHHHHHHVHCKHSHHNHQQSEARKGFLK